MCEEALKWIESNSNAETEEYEKKQKEIESVFNPIMTKIYQEGGNSQNFGNMPGNFGNSHQTEGPNVDMVD